jgi:hypothetical protein
VHGLNRNEKYVPVVIEPDCGKLGYNLLVDWRERIKSNFCCKKPSAMVSMLGSTLSGVLDRGGFAGGGLAG